MGDLRGGKGTSQRRSVVPKEDRSQREHARAEDHQHAATLAIPCLISEQNHLQTLSCHKWGNRKEEIKREPREKKHLLQK